MRRRPFAIYIVLGMAALRAGRPKPLRIAAWVAAQAVFLYIVWVAMVRNSSPWTG
ncbi:MAG TPA: SirB2 family protein [Burkholderiales bacterium]|nr:SirB2 family protein [Burkholderiales bacterium]